MANNDNTDRYDPDEFTPLLAKPIKRTRTMRETYELTFWGGCNSIRHKRHHETLEQAREEALRVLYLADNRAAMPAIIYLGRQQIATIR